MAKIAMIEGTSADILCSDSSEVASQIGKVNFEVNSTPGTYSAEFLTTNYISNVFKAIEEAKEMWENCKELALNYHIKLDDVPLPSFPVPLTQKYLKPEDTKTYLSNAPTYVAKATPPKKGLF